MRRLVDEDFFATHEIVGFDTNVFIYAVSGHPRYGAWCRSFLERVERGRNRGITSTVTLLELLVQPYRRGDSDLVNRLWALVTRMPGLSIVPLTLEIADRAAELRARRNLSTPDSVQIASAIQAGATGFVANDRAFRRVTEIDVLYLSDVA